LTDLEFSSGAFGELRDALRDEAMTVVAVPALCMVLLFKEQQKGSALTENEVLEAVESAPAITMTKEDAAKFAQRPGGADLDPANIWAEWQAFRAAQTGSDG
jgi:hypothetical protein